MGVGITAEDPAAGAWEGVHGRHEGLRGEYLVSAEGSPAQATVASAESSDHSAVGWCTHLQRHPESTGCATAGVPSQTHGIGTDLGVEPSRLSE